ncbi:enoyl-CoA hydratase/carnithine racemase [Streptomyces sp. LBL]|nr:enoyl-CoA hydratase/carnithine racemase [Streptomyces sp. LBL]
MLLRAEGPAFSFGGDFTAWRGMTARELRATFDRYLDVYNRFEQLPVPVIAAVQGGSASVAASNSRVGRPPW